jgi:hypothetical protein
MIHVVNKGNLVSLVWEEKKPAPDYPNKSKVMLFLEIINIFSLNLVATRKFHYNNKLIMCADFCVVLDQFVVCVKQQAGGCILLVFILFEAIENILHLLDVHQRVVLQLNTLIAVIWHFGKSRMFTRLSSLCLEFDDLGLFLFPWDLVVLPVLLLWAWT